MCLTYTPCKDLNVLQSKGDNNMKFIYNGSSCTTVIPPKMCTGEEKQKRDPAGLTW